MLIRTIVVQARCAELLVAEPVTMRVQLCARRIAVARVTADCRGHIG